MPKFYIMVGFPGSGKSTYAEKLSKETGAEIISSDSIREEKYGTRKITNNDKKVFKEMRRRIFKSLSEGKDVICDATNITVEKRASFLAKDCSADAEKIAIIVNKPVNVCIEQNKNRDESQRVPNVAIYTSAKRFVYPILEEGFDEIKEV